MRRECISTGTRQNNTLEVKYSETEIVNNGQNTKEDFSLYIKICDWQHESLWDSGEGKCLVLLNVYFKICSKHKTELLPIPIRIRETNGSDIDNQGEGDITFIMGKKT